MLHTPLAVRIGAQGSNLNVLFKYMSTLPLCNFENNIQYHYLCVPLLHVSKKVAAGHPFIWGGLNIYPDKKYIYSPLQID